MDKQPISIRIPCPRHTSEFIQRVNTDVNASQHLYCLECILHQQEDAHTLAPTLKPISEFVEAAAQFYAQHKNTATFSSDVPDEYFGLLSKQTEVLDSLSSHIVNQKKRVESEFDMLIQGVLQTLTSKKNEYLYSLDQQLSNLRYWYTSFAKQIKKAYPTPEDIPHLYPSRDDLIGKLQKITNDIQLTALMRGLKEDMNEQKRFGQNERLSLEEIRKKELSEIAHKLSQLEHVKPIYDMTHYNQGDTVSTLDQELDKILSKTIELKDPIEDVLQSLRGIDSKVIDHEQYNLIKKWLTSKYQSMQPKLLYRGQKDGMSGSSFHSKCDGKGATLTIMKCESKSNPSDVIKIGGFLDQSWLSSPHWIYSKEAFLFSVTAKLKCPVSANMEQYAAYGEASYGPTFGGGNDLLLQGDFSNLTIRQHSYANCAQLATVANDSKGGRKKKGGQFKVVEIEVFALSG